MRGRFGLRGAARWRHMVPIGIATAVIASLLTVLAAPEDESPQLEASAGTDLAPADVPRAGMVLVLSRPGFVDIPLARGMASAFHVDVSSASPVTAVELLAGSEQVALTTLDDEQLDRVDRFVWTPEDAGTVTLVARAHSEDGHVGQSNPLRVEVRDLESGPAAATDVPSISTDLELAPIRSVRMAGAPAMASQPTLTASSKGCTASIGATAGAPEQDLVLMQVPPTGGSFVPVSNVKDGTTALTLTSGLHDFVLAAGVSGEAVSWSNLVTVDIPDDECDSWTGDVSLKGNLLVADTDADLAYLYLSSLPGEWVRVPSTGFVARSAAGFDFEGLLPPLTGGALQLEAWGRKGGALVEIGAGSLVPPAGSGSQSAMGIGGVVGVPKVQLWFLQPDKDEPMKAPTPLTSASLGVATTLKFKWSAPIAGVTRGVVQVTPSPAPAQSPVPYDALYMQNVYGNGGTFTIDFQKVLAAWFAKQSKNSVNAALPLYSQLQAGEPTSWDPTPAPLETGAPDVEVEEATTKVFYVRVVPMANDSWTGLMSNDVDLTVDTSMGLTPEAPKGEFPYTLAVDLVSPPKPPDPSKLDCWQFTGWSDGYEKALAAEEAAFAKGPNPAGDLIFASLYPYMAWTALTKSIGSGPICGACYVSLSYGGHAVVDFNPTGGSCSSGTFLDDLYDAFKTLVNVVSSTYAYIKDKIVEIVTTVTGCNAVAGEMGGKTGEDLCHLVAMSALNAALIYFGIPPSLPNWDELIAAAKGDIVALGVELAESAGVPCDDATFAAEVSQQKNLTCEAALEALLDKAIEEMNLFYKDVAASMGFAFPALMKVRPHPAGQVAPAKVKITVNPTKYTAAEEGDTCPVGVYSWSTWQAPPAPFPPKSFTPAGVLVGTSIVPPGWFGGTYYDIPKLSWAGAPFEPGFWELPDLQKLGGYAPASQTYELYPPETYGPVDVGRVYQTTGIQQTQLVQQWTSMWSRWPVQTFLLNSGSTFKLVVKSGCAKAVVKQWLLPGFANGPAIEIPA